MHKCGHSNNHITLSKQYRFSAAVPTKNAGNRCNYKPAAMKRVKWCIQPAIREEAVRDSRRQGENHQNQR